MYLSFAFKKKGISVPSTSLRSEHFPSGIFWGTQWQLTFILRVLVIPYLDDWAPSTGDRCQIIRLAGEVDVHVSTISPAQQSHSETRDHPGGRSDTNSPLVAVTTVVSTSTASVCGPPSLLCAAFYYLFDTHGLSPLDYQRIQVLLSLIS